MSTPVPVEGKILCTCIMFAMAAAVVMITGTKYERRCYTVLWACGAVTFLDVLWWIWS